MTFQIFDNVPLKDKAYISITDGGSFGLSKAFVERFDIAADQKAIILYDDETQEIALNFVDGSAQIGFTLRITNPKHGVIMNARSFFEAKRIDPRRFSGKYTDFEIKELHDLGVEERG
jgi:hypothetical protein